MSGTATIKKITPNVRQQECIETLQGPVMVLAGPGTGKTFTVIERIKYMIKQGIVPETILCLTFSDAAASEMKIRLVREIGPVASSVSIYTYHAFCNDLIAQYSGLFELVEGVGIVDDISKRNLMKDSIDEYNPEFHRTRWGDAYYFINDLLRAVDEIKKNRVTKESYFNVLENNSVWMPKMEELLADKKEQEEKARIGKRNRLKTVEKNIESLKKKIGKAKEAWDIAEIYTKKLKENNFIDFNDMINLVLDAFDTDDEFLQKVRSNYKYFLVDEYQDTNFSQNSLIFYLAGEKADTNIFVVGDDDQIIYGFQGAQSDNLEKFLLKYPKTKVICLEENNRSTQTILDLSYKVISQDETRLEVRSDFEHYNISKKLTAKNPNINCLDRKAELHTFEELMQENNFVVEKIESLSKKDDVNLSDIAVLTRTNTELDVFADLLKAKNIPFQINKTKTIFELKPSILVYFYLRVLANPKLYGNSLFAVCASKPFDFNPEDYAYILGIQKKNHKDFISIINDELEEYDWLQKEKIESFIKTYDDLRVLKSHLSVKNLVISIINKTGILGYYVNSPINKFENISSIKKLVQEADSFSKLYPAHGLYEFIDHLNTAYLEDIPISIEKDAHVQDAVQLVSLHGSKGREFGHVFMPNLVSKSWEKKRTPNTADLPIEKSTFSEDESQALRSEQLKLLFVGITRAKHSLFLSCSNIINGKTAELTSYLSAIAHDNEMFERFTHTLSGEVLTDEMIKTLQEFDFNYQNCFKNELKARVKDFVLSPSSLNTYLSCPRKFLYSDIYKIPFIETESEAANYGNAVHKTLQWAVNRAKADSVYPDRSSFIDKFVHNLSNQRFETQEQRNVFEGRGKKYLSKYYERFIQSSISSIEGTEVRLDCIPVGEYMVKGFIDRIEKNSDGTYSVFDYKTGGAKSKSQIAEGKDFESYLNQLRFYKLAYETLYKGVTVSQTGIIFVEEHDKSVYLDMVPDDCEDIKEKIFSVYEKINELNFEPVDGENQQQKACDFCDYKMICRLNVI